MMLTDDRSDSASKINAIKANFTLKSDLCDTGLSKGTKRARSQECCVPFQGADAIAGDFHDGVWFTRFALIVSGAVVREILFWYLPS